MPSSSRLAMARRHTRRHRPSVLRNALLGGAVAWMLGSCSLVLEFDECRSNEDCTNAVGDAMVCNLDTNTCEAQPDPSDVVCEDNTTCTDLFTEDEAICGSSGRCALLTSDECSKVVRPAGTPDENIVWIGSILATSEPYATAVVPIENAVQMAIDDFNSGTSLADGRKVGLIACDSGGDPSRAQAAAEHLIEEVGVPAIIGPSLSQEVLAVASTAVESGTFLISPSATAASIASLDDSGLIWRTISSDTVQSNAIADRLATLDPPPESILVLAKNDEYGVGLFEPMLQRLSGQLSVPTGSLLYPDPVGLTADEAQRAYATVIAEGFAQEADTIVFLGASEVLEVLRAYLLAWNNTGMPLPRFVVSHGAVPSLLSAPAIVDPMFAPTLMGAMEGISPVVQDPANFDAFNVRYRVLFEDLNPLSPSPLGYDAALVTLLGMVAGGPDRGVDIASAMPRIADASGTAVALGDAQAVIDARELLVAGSNIDIGGVSGPLDFDLVTGEVSSNYVGWDVVPVAEDSPQGTLVARRAYVLDGATTGVWMDL